MKPQAVENPDLLAWILHIDGSSKLEGGGAGSVLIRPDGVIAEYALRFKFSTINNEAKYEALVMGLKITIELGVQRLKYSSTPS